MVGFKEKKESMYNYTYLIEEQKELEKQYKGRIAHADPDLREEFNCPNADWK